MFDSDQDQRTLPASPRRRANARQSGSVPRSPDATATLVLMVFTFGLVLIGPSLLMAGKEFIVESFTNPHTDASTSGLLEPSSAALGLSWIAAAWLLLAAAVAIIGNVVQFGLLFAPQVVQPDLERLSPRRGLQRMFSEFQPTALLLHCARLVTIAVISGWFIWSIWPRLVNPPLPAPEVIGETFADAVIILGSCLAGGAVIISLLMALAERMRHEARLRMTPQEAREEQQLNEADPAVTRRRRETQQQIVATIGSPTTAGRRH